MQAFADAAVDWKLATPQLAPLPDTKTKFLYAASGCSTLLFDRNDKLFAPVSVLHLDVVVDLNEDGTMDIKVCQLPRCC